MSIDPSSYHRIEIFDSEMDFLFSQRMFVGLADDFTEKDSYLSLRVGRKAVSVRGTLDGIRAFNNVCLHRSSLIDPIGSGVREFRCGYHGWAYGSDGELRSAPLVDNPNLKTSRLHQYALNTIGNLFFLSLTETPPHVSNVELAVAWLGVRTDAIRPFFADELTIECNWKVLVENNIESYHLSFVHPGSFLPAGFNSRSKYEWGFDEYTCWSSCTPTNTSKLIALQKLARDAKHEFRHAYIFPNLFLTTTNQLIGFLSFMLPIGPAKTLLKWRLFDLPQLNSLSEGVKAEIRREAIRFTSTSLLEDKPVVENCQAGLSSESATIQLQEPDSRIGRFHSYYLECMDRARR